LFNGFVSKWSIYVAAIQGSNSARYLPVCAIVAILTSVLTLASFIKFFGVSFLSRTSALVAERAARIGRLEVGWMMQLPQLVLASLCVLLGVVPAIAFRLMQQALSTSRQGFGTVLSQSAPMMSGPLPGLKESGAAALFAPLAFAAVLGLMFLVAYGISRIGKASRRASVPWLCGYVREQDCHRYVAHNFYGEIKRYFRWLGGTPPRPSGKPVVLKED
jgi:hydrogenase-4 component B